MRLERLDHRVSTVADIERTVEFYTRVLGMRRVEFGAGRAALGFGEQKINLHRHGRDFEPRAGRVQPGSADPCFIAEDPIDAVLDEIKRHRVAVIDGPVARTGARGEIVSIYLRDPDDNQIEIANYIA